MGPHKSCRLPFSLALQSRCFLVPSPFRERVALLRRVRSAAAALRDALNHTLLSGAGNGTRTRDPELGRLALYQLSYSRSLLSLPSTPLRSASGRLRRGFARFAPHLMLSQSIANSPRCPRIPDYVWWRGEDSNLRRRSPSDLQSDPFGHSGTSPYMSFSAPLCLAPDISNQSRWSESNRRPTDYKSVALPTELHRQRAKEGKLCAGYHAVKNQPI